MSAAAMLAHLILERLSRRVLDRVPEPDLIMQEPAQLAAFVESGSEDGALAFTHFFHALQITPLIQPGDHVLDLACGPANQLAQIAMLNPQARFTGLDASPSMLQLARGTLARCGVNNVQLVSGDMTHLHGMEDAAMDGVVCTMSLHHLPDLPALQATLREIRRVLKPGGSLYLVDFGRLQRTSTQRFFSQDRRSCQSEQFTRDYFNSLRAAFSLAELSQAAALLGDGVIRYATPLAPFMVVFKTASRRRLDPATELTVRRQYARLTAAQQQDFRVFARWFRGAGYRLPCDLP
jgi:ubiquinone/menaquinone biosynthesis C-methylase UbiE